jgi:ankyrin repeat protein
MDILDEHGMTPLQHAAYKGNEQIVRWLLDRVSSAGSWYIALVVGDGLCRSIGLSLFFHPRAPTSILESTSTSTPHCISPP